MAADRIEERHRESWAPYLPKPGPQEPRTLGERIGTVERAYFRRLREIQIQAPHLGTEQQQQLARNYARRPDPKVLAAWDDPEYERQWRRSVGWERESRTP